MNISLKKVYGPPGSGKTTWLIKYMEESEVPFERIAFVSFARATIKNLTDRYNLSKEQSQYFRTVHGMCYHLLKIRKGKLAHEHLKNFPARFSVDFLQRETNKSIDTSQTLVATDSIDDSFYHQMMLERTNLLPRDYVPPHFSHTSGLYLSFKQRYFNWLRDNDFIDFVGLLEQAYEQNKVPPVDLLCVDEWQDLTPLQVRLVNLWSQNIPKSVHTGDDDQTIHEWAGANHQDFLDFPVFTPHDQETIILNKTYRLPPKVLDMSVAYIRKNTKRVDKEFVPTKKESGLIEYGHIDKIAEILKEQIKKGTCKVLVRNNSLIPLLMKDLSIRGLPVTNNQALRNCVRAIGMLKNKKTHLTVDDLYFISDSTNTVFPASKFFKHGGKKELRFIADAIAAQGDESISLTDLLQYKVKDEFVMAFQNGDVTDLRSPYLQEALLIHKQYGENFRPIEIASIHSSKGTEADTVVVCLDMSKRTYIESRNPVKIEEERRVWYVAITRTKKNLLFLKPTYRYFYPSPITDYVKLYIQNEQS